jgi:O-antigen ligase
MSAGRTGQFSLFITAFILIFIYFKQDVKAIFFSVVVLCLSIIIAYNTLDTFNSRINRGIIDIEQMIYHQKMDSSLGTRIASFDTIPYLMNKDNILYGVGMGDKPTYVSQTVKSTYPYRLYNFDEHGMLHNSYVEILVSNGLVGLFFYLALFYYLLFVRIKDQLVQYIARSISLYFLCYGMVADIFIFRQPMLLFSLFIAIVIIQQQSELESLPH